MPMKAVKITEINNGKRKAVNHVTRFAYDNYHE
jgi:hypothetical protein